MKSSRKRSLDEKIGSILKLGLECLLEIKEKAYHSIFSCPSTTDTSDVKWYFPGFSFLKENTLHFSNKSKYFFTTPSAVFKDDIFIFRN